MHWEGKSICCGGGMQYGTYDDRERIEAIRVTFCPTKNAGARRTILNNTVYQM